MFTSSRGHFYEWVAAVHYERAGFKILRRNLRTIFGEMDLVTLSGESLWIIEVRGRENASYPPHRYLSPAKIRRLKRLARWTSWRYRMSARIELAEIIGRIPEKSERKKAIRAPDRFQIQIRRYPILE